MKFGFKSKSQCIDNFSGHSFGFKWKFQKFSVTPKFGNPTFTRVVPSARSTLIRKFARVGRWIIKTIHRRTMIQYQVLSPSPIACTHGNQVLPAFRNSKEISRVVLSSKLFNDRVTRKRKFSKKKKKCVSKAKQNKARRNKTSNTMMFRHFRWTFVARYEILHYHLYWVSQCPTISTIFHRVSAYPAIWRRWTRS